MIDKVILDADFCIKLGSIARYRFLYDVVPLVARKAYMHTYTKTEVMAPTSAVRQLQDLISEGKVEQVDESGLNKEDRAVYDATYRNLGQVMLDPQRPRKNKGDVCSLAYAKAKGIPFFATDEKDLQQIIDVRLNTDIDKDIQCIRIVDIVTMAHDGDISIPRKICKALWCIAGKKKEIFDTMLWPL